MTHDDQTLLELEHTLNAVSFPPLNDSVRSEHLRRLRTTTAAESGGSTTRRRSLAVAIMGVGLVIGSGGAAAAWIAAQRPTQTEWISCFASATRDFDDDTLFFNASLAGPGSAAESSLGICGSAWRTGAISNAKPRFRDPDPSADLPVPPLSACVLPDGRVGVFPIPNCTAIHLATADLD